MRSYKFIAALLLAAVLILAGAPAARADALEASLAMDVMYVIDNSGSMSMSDPQYIAPEACRLFASMCVVERSRVGYVRFSDKLDETMPMTDMAQPGSYEAVMNALASIQYPELAYTDISLGLTEGVRLMEEAGSFNGDRKPVIILFSDGRTEAISEERWSVYDQELADTFSRIQSYGVHVYTIGMIANGDADEQTLQSLADQSDGLYFPVSDVSELSGILTTILAREINAGIIPIDATVATGGPQTFTIPITDDSVYQANIVILSGQPVTDLHLVEPGGNEVLIPSERVVLSTSSHYTLVKLITPARGDWQLTFTGVENDSISLSLIKSYDMRLQLGVEPAELYVGDTARFSVYFADGDQPIGDTGVFDGATGTLYVTGPDGQTTETPMTPSGSAYMVADVVMPAAGQYVLGAKVVGAENAYERTIDSVGVQVAPRPLSVKNGGESSERLFTPLFGLNILSTKTIPMDQLLQDGEAASVTSVPSELCQVEQTEDGAVRLTALHSGSGPVEITINDIYGQSVPYTFNVQVVSTMMLFIALLAVIAVIVVLAIVIARASRPKLEGKLTVSMKAPAADGEMGGYGPSQAVIDMDTLRLKGPMSLAALMSRYDGSTWEKYRKAMEGGVERFVKTKLQFFGTKKKKGGTPGLRMTVEPMKGCDVYVGETEVKRKVERSMSSMSVSVTCGEYEFTLSYDPGASEPTSAFDLDFGGSGGDSFGGSGSGGKKGGKKSGIPDFDDLSF